MEYKFKNIEACDMCGSASTSHKILGRRLNQSQGKNPRNKTGITTTVCKCSNCGLIYSNPQPIPVNLQEQYGIPPEDYWKDVNYEADATGVSEHMRILEQLMEVAPGMKSLDIGAGLGQRMIAMEKLGFDTYGLEPSEPFYERAISKVGVDPEKLSLCSLEGAEYSANTFDFISFGAVLEHLHSPSMAIKKSLEWLKPNGIIQIEVPQSEWFVAKLINFYYRMTLTDYVTNLSPMHTPFHHFEFSLDSFKENGKRNAYSIAYHQYFVCKTFLPKILDAPLKRYMGKTDSGMEIEVWLRKPGLHDPKP